MPSIESDLSPNEGGGSNSNDLDFLADLRVTAALCTTLDIIFVASLFVLLICILGMEDVRLTGGIACNTGDDNGELLAFDNGDDNDGLLAFNTGDDNKVLLEVDFGVVDEMEVRRIEEPFLPSHNFLMFAAFFRAFMCSDCMDSMRIVWQMLCA